MPSTPNPAPSTIQQPDPPSSGPGSLTTMLRFALLFMLLCGLAYPALTTLVAHTLFPHQADGSLIRVHGTVVGSSLVGQPFSGDAYFIGRPSASDYHAFTMAASNLAVSNPALRQRAQATSLAIQHREHVPASRIPVDLIAASGSGIDPDISPAAARLEAPRVARARNLPLDQVEQMIAHATHTGPLDLGQSAVNVLELNLALDAATGNPGRAPSP